MLRLGNLNVDARLHAKGGVCRCGGGGLLLGLGDTGAPLEHDLRWIALMARMLLRRLGACS